MSLRISVRKNEHAVSAEELAIMELRANRVRKRTGLGITKVQELQTERLAE